MILLEKDLDPAVADPGDVLEALQEADVSESRLEEIEGGAALTGPEVAVWREHLVCATFDAERVSTRERNVCVVVEVKHSDGRRAHLAIQKWNGESGVLVATYETCTEAVTAVKNIGVFVTDSGLTFDEQSERGRG